MDPRKQTPMKDPHEQEAPQRRRRPPVLIRTILPDKIIHVHRDDFKPLVQNLTGKPSTVVDGISWWFAISGLLVCCYGEC
ncbi:unnamed protein product [Arabis nemorensis]|uniref:VQ domain-containing protein n=1 Tax=Arabis nemorensis TaxID=586526 RepID=A0A565ATW5_9BRAS|nr:unnamed protein product [Arabis nemorensis]